MSSIEPTPVSRLLDETALQRIASDVARAAKPGDCFCLNGDLGAGKSTFARAFIRALAGHGDMDVPSPTFTLVQTYDLTPPVAHFDLYRLSDSQEVEELGLPDALEDGVALVEWPDKAENYLPADCISISLSIPASDRDRRTFTIHGPNAFMKRLARSLAIRDVLAQAGWANADRMPLMADASVRGYERVMLDGDQRIIMDAPATPDGPPVRDGKPYSQIAHLAENVSAFVAIAKALRAKGFKAPDIHHYDLDKGIVLLEHLGSAGIVDDNKNPIADRYAEAARCLAALHRAEWKNSISIEQGRTHHIAGYDIDVFCIEASLLLDWYVPWRSGKAISDTDRTAYEKAFEALHGLFDPKNHTLLLRDYHSPNIIWCDGDTPKQRIGLIDFQDALIGPAAYDVISLAEDARVDLSEDVRNGVITAYCEAMETSGDFDRSAFNREAAIVAAQRSCKILGIFVRLNERDGKPAYMDHLPRVEASLKRALQHTDLGELKSCLKQMGVV